MCCVSVISDYFNPSTGNVKITQWDGSGWAAYQEVLRKLQELDEKLSQPHCEDPEKTEWMRSVEKRLQSLEAS